MQAELAKILIENKVIKEHTLVEANYFAKGLSCAENSKVVGTFAIIQAVKRDNKIYLKAFNEDNITKEINIEDIISVDGMDEARLARAFMFSTDGEKIREGKRRGRKPKGYVEENTSEEDLTLAYEYMRLLNYGWSEEDIAKHKNSSLAEIERVLNTAYSDEYDDEDGDDDEVSDDDE